jgi:hypothetical protein
MPSQLLKNDKISFVVAKPFTSRDKTYEVGEDFPQEDARDIEVFVRARYVIPVVDSIEDKQHIRHWHRHIRPKDEVLARLERERVQLRMPHEYDSDEVVDITVLTHPHTTPEPEGDGESALPEETTVTYDPPAQEGDEEPEPPESLEETYDPAEHNVDAVKEYIAEHPEQKDQVLAMEAAGRGRKGLLGDDE